LSGPGSAIKAEAEPRPSLALVLAAGGAIVLVSALSLPWPLALASTALGLLMVAGAEIDARYYLLPDAITLATFLCGMAAALVLEPLAPWHAMLHAAARAAGTAAALAALRFAYARLRGEEGLGLGDVKLAAGVGAWLPLESIPLCFALATGAALVHALLLRLRGREIGRTTPLPFGAFLCPALWLVFYAGVVAG
jgi:leader peptidase (prepilin peptidase) / N-methyltransferase